MEPQVSRYFLEVEAPCVEGRCLHLLSDVLLISLLTYLTGGADYQDMYLFAKERGHEFEGLLSLSNGAPSAETFERDFKKLKSESLQTCLNHYEQTILQTLSEKQIVLDDKNSRAYSLTVKATKGCIYSMRRG